MLNTVSPIEKALRYEGEFGPVQDDFPLLVKPGLTPRRPRRPAGFEPVAAEEHFPMPEAASPAGVEYTLSYQGNAMHLLESVGDVAIASML